MKVVFTGDLFLGGDLADKPVKKLINVPEFHSADARIVNLEHPIGEKLEIDENKSTLFAGLYAINQLKNLRVSAVGLANNHIQDIGIRGIGNTVKLLKESGFGVFGAGKDLNFACKPYWLNNKYAVFGYCDYGRPHLKQVQVAADSQPGVAPLRIKKITSDLKQLKQDQQAILFLHWGEEHVSIPPYDDIKLARELLANKKVAGIVGMHAHRVQGVISRGNKKAFMCLGNFLFPNFYIKPPVQITYPKINESNTPITRQYHKVFGLTYKKWKKVNRKSIMLELDLSNDELFWKKIPVIQKDNSPTVFKIKGLALYLFYIKQGFLSFVYCLPGYQNLYKINSSLRRVSWRAGILIFRFRMKGIIDTIKFIVKKLK